jgi:hypothetical protein
MRVLDSWAGVHRDSKHSALSMSMDACMVCANSVKMNNSAFFTSSAVRFSP